MNTLINLIRADLREFNPYSSARDEAKQGKILLNANESPFDFEWQKGVKLNRYPQKQPLALVKRLADLYQVAIDQITMARGSDEMIDLLIRLFCSSGKDAILTCTPTYGMYAVYAKLQGCHVIEVPLQKENDFAIDVAAIQASVTENVKIIFLCSPNNPTGNLLKKADILALCEWFQGKGIVVLDEAYIEYANDNSLADYINQWDNLLILRTLSKAYGLAGVRFGALLANKDIVTWILKIIAPYPLASTTSKLVFDALSPELLSQIQQEITCVKSERKRLFAALAAMSFVKKVWPSEANYLLVETTNAQQIMHACAKHGIVLRSMLDKVGIDHGVRISIGLPEENACLINLLNEIKPC